MKKSMLIALAAVAVLSATSLAAPTCKLTIGSGPWPYAPYTVNRTGDLAEWESLNVNDNFNTFCIQSSIPFALNTTYYVTIEDTIRQTPTMLLADNTKKLYAAYLNGSLGGYSANDIQVTVWNSLGMSPMYSTSATSFLAGFVSNINSYDITGWENVKALNLWKNADLTGEAQSQLVMVTPVPAPGAVLLTGIGTALVGWLRRRHTV